ncbi:hypothetical protein T12_9297 [Trichinella patagoniensis]|uniref:Uncharacterized protein n=1 Tax=Trichinella patagoniensis TaxID=990121 RepID=A0A0V1AE70_9BILA|nr:hypothetical protein T12_9297 [Trichinella patagoniensis]
MRQCCSRAGGCQTEDMTARRNPPVDTGPSSPNDECVRVETVCYGPPLAFSPDMDPTEWLDPVEDFFYVSGVPLCFYALIKAPSYSATAEGCVCAAREYGPSTWEAGEDGYSQIRCPLQETTIPTSSASVSTSELVCFRFCAPFDGSSDAKANANVARVPDIPTVTEQRFLGSPPPPEPSSLMDLTALRPTDAVAHQRRRPRQ